MGRLLPHDHMHMRNKEVNFLYCVALFPDLFKLSLVVSSSHMTISTSLQPLHLGESGDAANFDGVK